MTEPLGWIWEENLRPFITFVASLADYDLDDDELGVYLSAISESDAEEKHWVKIEFNEHVIELAKDQGTAVVFTKANASFPNALEIRGVVSFLATYLAVSRQ